MDQLLPFAGVADYAPPSAAADPYGQLGADAALAPAEPPAPPPTAPPTQLAVPPPVPTPQAPSQASAGLTLVGAAVAGAAGYGLSRNGYGAAAGVLYYGAACNAWRATRQAGADAVEAVKSGTIALFGVAAAAYLTHKAMGATE